MKEYNILFLATNAPWKKISWKNWQHQDAILKHLCNMMNAKVTVGIPTKNKNALRATMQGDNSHLFESWCEIPVEFNEYLYEGEFDAIITEFTGWFHDNQVPVKDSDEILSNEKVKEYVVKVTEKAMNEGKPIIMFDPDAFIYDTTRLIVNSHNSVAWYYDLVKDYENLTVTSPTEVKITEINNWLFVPYNIDPDTINTDIKPLSERNYVTKYVGNNLKRDQFANYFNKCTEHGNVYVQGNFWNDYYDKYPNVEWVGKRPLPQEKVNEMYGDMKIGIYGTVDGFSDLKHYTLRIREYLQAGVLIVPERDYIIDKLVIEEFPYTAYDLLDDKKRQEMMDRLDNMSDEEYEYLVNKQREKALLTFDAKIYAKQYEQVLKNN